MRISVDWLREFIPVPETRPELEAFADALTMAGLEVEEILEAPTGPVFLTKITPNRGDWASVYGTAREAFALTSNSSPLGSPLSPNPFPPKREKGEKAGILGLTSLSPASGERGWGIGGFAEGQGVKVESSLCPRYSATIIRGVKIGATPEWMQARLRAALGDTGYRTINNVADITNYVMLELGQPLHAFDLATLAESRIVVRLARDGERIKTLDGGDRALTSEMLAICDAERPIAIAGIMGGAESEITDGTVDVLLESAHFNPLSVRRTSRLTDIKSGAAYRFERYVDPELVPVAAARAAQLITEIAGGTVESVTDVYPGKLPPRRVIARVDRIRKLLGADVDRDALIAALERLGLSVERSGGALDCIIPSWRPDLTMEDDIAEEVGRIALGLREPAGDDSPDPKRARRRFAAWLVYQPR